MNLGNFVSGMIKSWISILNAHTVNTALLRMVARNAADELSWERQGTFGRYKRTSRYFWTIGTAYILT